jgi:outer membrane protein assembly factor BamD
MKKWNEWVSVSLLFLAACSSIAVDENDPASVFKDAQAEMESDHYQIAIDKFRALKSKFPYSTYAVEAQLQIADVYFKEDFFAEAAASYETFKDLHPRHQKVGYAMFRMGKSYLNDSPTLVARDLSPLKKALESYQNFLIRFPTAPEAPEAIKDIAKIRNLLAEKELEIGNFYYTRKFYESAKPRYEKVLHVYPESTAAEVARGKITQIQQEHNDTKEAPKNGLR